MSSKELLEKFPTYEEYKRIKQEEFNALPIFFAFSNDQFRTAMEKRGLTEKDTDKIYSFGMGGFYLRSDAQIIRDYMNKEDEIEELMNIPSFAVSAFEYEMHNHEYGINWQGDYDVCNCFVACSYGDTKDFTDYLDEAGHSDWIPFYAQAKENYHNWDANREE